MPSWKRKTPRPPGRSSCPQADTFEPQEGGAYYTGLAGGELAGYVFETGASGYGGTVSVMTGIDAEGSITGVVILSHDETPGLGANATKSSFLDQYLAARPGRRPLCGEIPDRPPMARSRP